MPAGGTGRRRRPVDKSRRSDGRQGPRKPKQKCYGLLPKHKYTFCLVAHNEAGETHVGLPATFETGVIEASRGVETGAAEGVTLTTASLRGKLNPGGEAKYYIEYGTHSAPGDGNMRRKGLPKRLPPGKRSRTILRSK